MAYSQKLAVTDAALAERIRLAETRAESNGNAIVHPLRLGRMLMDKTATNLAWRDAGVAVPRLALGKTAPQRIFSNENMNTRAKTFVLERGDDVDQTRYNAEFIDTVHDYRGNLFYVSLRAMAVGERCVSVFVRARPVNSGDPSVHSADTPLDAGLLNYFHSTIVEPHRETIAAICKKIGSAWGLAFFSHDILPCSQTGTMFVCESGLKFDDRTLHAHLSRLEGLVSFVGHERDIIRTGQAFADEAERLRYF